MIEVLLASTLLASGLVAVASVTAAAARGMTTAWALEDGTATVQAIVDSLSATTTGGSGTRGEGRGRITWSVAAGNGAQGWVRYEHPALSSPVEVVFVTMASW
ncbi:MAG: hypothetical protein HKN73_18135 [Gemmatimonadetes bacterium]|nr:hypothetical protein [Gemmatimonadota bacterium]